MSQLPQRIHRALAARTPLFHVMLALPLLFGTSFAETFLGLDLNPLSIVPVALAARYAGRGVGLGMAAAAAVCMLGASLQRDPAAASPLLFLSAAVWLLGLSFLAVVSTTSALHADSPSVDPLTGVDGAKLLHSAIDTEIGSCRDRGEPFTLACIDLDGLRAINRASGYETGDELLCAVAVVISCTRREGDRVARVGGDEFALLLPDTDAATATGRLIQVRARLMNEMQREGWPITFSIGAVTFENPPRAPERVLRIVDSLVYDAKQQGRDTILHLLDSELTTDGMADPTDETVTLRKPAGK